MASETTAAPNNTALQSEVSAVLPDTAEKKTPGEAVPPTATATETAAAGPAASEAEPAKTKEPAKAETTEKPAEKKATPVEELWKLAKSHGHPEVWGVTLADPTSHTPSQVVLQKYLNANDGDLVKAKDQLTKTLDWRAKMKPVELLKKNFSRSKFAGLGYVTTYGDAGGADPATKEVFTWNIYGSVKNMEATFGNLEEFLEWRVALMEEALASLGIDQATKPITADHDPYKILQVHDYRSISFLRQSAVVRAASTETIKIFAQNYPELLKEKFFVNVPVFMGFIYAFMKLFVAQKTIKKFHPMSNGGDLAREMVTSSGVKGLGDMLPEEYGGKGAALDAAGKQPRLEEASAAQ